jgi:di/tricarboxylate transporter
MMAFDRSSVFWAAFWAGLASPMSVYASPPNYLALGAIPSPAQNFAAVGMALSRLYQRSDDQRSGAEGPTSGA